MAMLRQAARNESPPMSQTIWDAAAESVGVGVNYAAAPTGTQSYSAVSLTGRGL